jgi:transcriptional regulator with XRE-family HTH domain
MPETGTVPLLNITQLCERVIELARQTVHSGSISERGLAKKANISQPHLHNVLKGIRTLSPEGMDRLLEALNVTVPEVLWSGSGNQFADIRSAPLLRNRIGPGTEASFSAFRGYVPFPAKLLSRLKEPLAAYLGADLALPSEYRAGDLVLLDLNPALRATPTPSFCWIVAESAGLRVRYVRRVRGGVEVCRESAPSDDGHWQPIPFQGRSILEIVRARIVWIGREMETLAGPPGQARAGD